MLLCFWCKDEHNDSPTFGEGNPKPETPAFTYKHCNQCRSIIADNGLAIEYSLTPIYPGQISLFSGHAIYPTGRQALMPMTDPDMAARVLGPLRAEALLRFGMVLLTQSEWVQCRLPTMRQHEKAEQQQVVKVAMAMPDREIQRIIENYHRHKKDPAKLGNPVGTVNPTGYASVSCTGGEAIARPACEIHRAAPGCH